MSQDSGRESQLERHLKGAEEGCFQSTDSLAKILRSSTDFDSLHSILVVAQTLPHREMLADGVVRLSQGIPIDSQNDLRILALYLLPNVTEPTTEIEDIVRGALTHENLGVREAAAVSTQLFAGVEVPLVDWGDDESELTERLDWDGMWKSIMSA